MAIWAGGDAAGSAPILDDDLLPKRAHLFRGGARHDVVAAAGGVGDDQRDGMRTGRARLRRPRQVRMIAYFPSILGLGIDNIRGRIADLRELGKLKKPENQLLAPWQRC